MTSRIPHLLEPYLTLPDEAGLIVLTSVLGASTNWLLLRHIYSLLKPSSSPLTSRPSPSHVTWPGGDCRRGSTEDQQQHQGQQQQQQRQEEEEDVAVLLVSFLRDFAFWRENAARLGLDLEAAARRGRFAYVDGLSSLFSPAPSSHGPGQQQQQQQQRGVGVEGWKRVLTSPAPGDMGRVFLESVEQLKKKEKKGGLSTGAGNGSFEGGGGRKVVLVIDGLDFVLAASNPAAGTAAIALREMLMDLRETTHAAIVTLAADDPLVKEQETSLEKQHAWFTLHLAHEADTVMSLRLLDTGAAKDVSGVIRITGGGGMSHTEGHEYLYHVGGDGGVKVFERGQ
ncbi:uncharacterized protein B0T15DRAFT_389480 [Chaetomium strumarium]|uniref:Elongator complex protein 6 n=1 Tax=Chaetomium strumarium TaxID=1170767 RepID=A0AAJ0M720_9PEZI|nr:hypothetical protein B0T15DRAFT_389480 [Chaetomium strumarium]